MEMGKKEITPLAEKKSVINSVRRTFLFAFILIASAFYNSTFADTIQYNSIVYNITSDSTVEVASNQDTSLSGVLVIPDTITAINDSNYIVTSIGDSAFIGCSSLTNITIPNSITSINIDAFARCSSLTNINIPNSVTSIRKRAFARCWSLANITIPNSVTVIANDAFYECNLDTVICKATTPPTFGSDVF